MNEFQPGANGISAEDRAVDLPGGVGLHGIAARQPQRAVRAQLPGVVEDEPDRHAPVLLGRQPCARRRPSRTSCSPTPEVAPDALIRALCERNRGMTHDSLTETSRIRRWQRRSCHATSSCSRPGLLVLEACADDLEAIHRNGADACSRAVAAPPSEFAPTVRARCQRHHGVVSEDGQTLLAFTVEATGAAVHARVY